MRAATLQRKVHEYWISVGPPLLRRFQYGRPNSGYRLCSAEFQNAAFKDGASPRDSAVSLTSDGSGHDPSCHASNDDNAGVPSGRASNAATAHLSKH
jgi:hypothetical protein